MKKMNIDVEIWKDSTEDTLQELFELLITDVGMSEEDANEYVQNVYYAIANEFGA